MIFIRRANPASLRSRLPVAVVLIANIHGCGTVPMSFAHGPISSISQS
jgi:hypothetical protein